MVDFTDLKFAQMLSGRLDNFKIRHTNPYKINFRCPLCGDSQKSRSKARGWLLEKENTLLYYCHNCGASQSFSYFLKGLDQIAYNDYVAEKFISKANNEPKESKTDDSLFKTKAPTFNKTNPLTKIKKISQLKHDHPVKKYIQQRKIPPQHHYRLYYARHFKTWINSILPGKFENVGKDEPRLVIPFLDENGKCFGVSARGFDPKGIRYITIMFEERPKIFGLDKVNFNEPYYIVEGAIDSFLKKRLMNLTMNWGDRLDFFDIAKQSPQEFYQGNAPLKYAQAWTMIHFFMESGYPKAKERFFDYLKAYKALETPEDKKKAQEGAKMQYIWNDTLGQLDPKKAKAAWEEHVEKLAKRAGLSWRRS